MRIILKNRQGGTVWDTTIDTTEGHPEVITKAGRAYANVPRRDHNTKEIYLLYVEVSVAHL